MLSPSKLLSASALATCCCLSFAASAQDAAPVTDPSATEGTPAVPTNSTLSMAPPTTIPLANEERADVVERSWPNRPLLITGGVLLVGTYGASAIVGAVSDREADEKLFYPVVGPWLDLKDRDCDVNDCGSETLDKTLLIGSGILQGVGAVAIVLGLVVPESKEKPWYLIGNEQLHVTPQANLQLTGLTASGRF